MIASLRHLNLATSIFGLPAGSLVLQSAIAASDWAASWCVQCGLLLALSNPTPHKGHADKRGAERMHGSHALAPKD
jgi:hypothetical protein